MYVLRSDNVITCHSQVSELVVILHKYNINAPKLNIIMELFCDWFLKIISIYTTWENNNNLE